MTSGIPFNYFFGPNGPGDVPPEDFHWHEHCDDCTDHCADDCDDQLPAIANVGRGPSGDGFYVTIDDPDSCVETHLQGWSRDGITGMLSKEWESLNINGGELYYQYNLRPYTNPQTFTITFIYRRPQRCEWSWTTPAVPYIWDANGDGEPDVDGIIGSGVGDIYIRTASSDHEQLIDGKDPNDAAWNERLHFPPGTTAKDFNAPQPKEAWSATITFGLHGGDVLVPNIYDLASTIGFSPDVIFKVTRGDKGQFKGGLFDVTCDTLKDYIDQNDADLLDHVHDDLGFNNSGHPDDGAFGGEDTVKEYIDREIEKLQDQINNILQSLGDIIYGATTDEDGNISIPEGTKIPVADLNVFAGYESPNRDNYADAIRSRSISDNDIAFR